MSEMFLLYIQGWANGMAVPHFEQNFYSMCTPFSTQTPSKLRAKCVVSQCPRESLVSLMMIGMASSSSEHFRSSVTDLPDKLYQPGYDFHFSVYNFGQSKPIN